MICSQYRSIIDKCCPNNSSYGCDFYKMSLDRNNKCYNDSLTLNQANVFTGLDPFFLYYTCRLDEPDSTTNQHSGRFFNYASEKYKAVEGRQQLHALIIMIRRFIYKEQTCAVLSIFPALSLCMKAANIENTYDLTVTHYITQHDNVKKVIDAKKKVALFYGDVDSMCNAIHGAQFASGLGLKLLAPQSIYVDQQQKPPTIGFITQYEGLDFLTVRGAGHFVTSSNEKPKEGLQLFVNFLRGTNYSTPIDYVSPTSPSTPTSCPTGAPPSTSTHNSSSALRYRYLGFVLAISMLLGK
ncbi:hypothetical protein COOONC_07097 [Cooperia oncophora]